MTKSKRVATQTLRKTEAVDRKLADAVALSARRTPGRWTRRLAEIGDQPPLVAVSLAVIATGLAGRNARLGRTGFRMLTAHSLSTIVKLAGKDNIDRTRPGAVGQKSYRLKQGTSRDGRLRSMPSGHSAGIVAIAGAITVDYPHLLLPAAAASVAVAGAQLPSRNHYLSDVVVGAGIGLAVAGLARLLIPPFDEGSATRRK